MLIPGMMANMTPPLVKRVKFLEYPVDMGKKYRGKPIFGKNKTYRGFFFGIISACVGVYVQKILYLDHAWFRELSLIPYGEINFLLAGFLIGFGVLFGDVIESFFKRQKGIKPGEKWFPWDQIDALIGGLVFLSFAYIPPWQAILIVLVLVPVLHVGINHLGFYLGLQKNKW